MSRFPAPLRTRKALRSGIVLVLLVVVAVLPVALMACTSRPAAGSSSQSASSSSGPGAGGSILQSTDSRTQAIEREIAQLVSLQTSQAQDYKLQLDAIQKQLNAIQKDIADIKARLK